MTSLMVHHGTTKAKEEVDHQSLLCTYPKVPMIPLMAFTTKYPSRTYMGTTAAMRRPQRQRLRQTLQQRVPNSRGAVTGQNH